MPWGKGRPPGISYLTNLYVLPMTDPMDLRALGVHIFLNPKVQLLVLRPLAATTGQPHIPLSPWGRIANLIANNANLYDLGACCINTANC